MTGKNRTLLKGFTIIELVTVIVVIGILAAITIVAYNGGQMRARNVKTTVAAEQYKDGLENYLTLKKAYPSVDASQNYCLGIDVGACTTSPYWIRSTALETALKSVMDDIPVPNTAYGVASTGDPVLGYIPYRGTGDPKFDGVTSGFLIYILEGYVTCPVGPVASGVWPNFSSTAPVNGRTYIVGTVSVCWVPLPKP